MEKRLFYTSPVDHHHLEDWPSLARALNRAIKAACDRDVTVELGEQPVFGYGTDAEEAVAAVEEQHLAPRTVRVDLWCSIVFYATICVTLGSGIRRNERRSLARRLEKKALAKQVLMREHEGPWDFDSGRSYGYSLRPADAGHRSAIEFLMIPFDSPIYLGERWLLMDGNEKIDEEAFDLIVPAGPNLGLFTAKNRSAEEQIWQNCFAGEGLIAFYPEDPAEKLLIQRFSDFEDLRIFRAEAPSPGQRVTLGRCHQDDSLVVVHDVSYAPEIEQTPLFII